ncbi:MAG: hypothetical protein ACLPVI_09320 [Dehalococcoidales bacterium]
MGTHRVAIFVDGADLDKSPNDSSWTPGITCSKLPPVLDYRVKPDNDKRGLSFTPHLVIPDLIGNPASTTLLVMHDFGFIALDLPQVP